MIPHLRFESAAPVMIVESVEPTRDFFRDRLGFTELAAVPHEDTLGFSMLEKDGVTIMVHRTPASSPMSVTTRREPSTKRSPAAAR